MARSANGPCSVAHRGGSLQVLRLKHGISINLATDFDLLRRTFLTAWFWIKHFASDDCDEPGIQVEALELDNAELARASAVKSSTSFNWVHGKAKSIKGGAFLRAAKALGVEHEWLAIGGGRMGDDPASTRTEKVAGTR